MDRVCAGIVLYNPDLERMARNIRNAAGQVEEVFLVDNGSRNIAGIRDAVKAVPNLTLMENAGNLGIATALNQLCRAAEGKGYSWILTLDQDTIIQEDMIRIMGRYCEEGQIGIVCPAVYYEGWKEKPELSGKTEQVKACMTSASLTRLSAWKKVGGFRDEFFIDYVDNDFCQKLRMHGYTILRVHACCMTHSLGEIRVIRTLNKETRRVTHKPWRYYYMIRNNIVFVRDYGKYLNKPKEWLKILYIGISGLRNTDKKRETFRYIIRGIRDAKAGKMGKMAAS